MKLLDDLGRIQSIVMIDDWNDPDNYWSRASLNCSVLTDKGAFRINTDKYGRAELGYINGQLPNGMDVCSTDKTLIASLVRIIKGDEFVRSGTAMSPLSETESEAVFVQHQIPRIPDINPEGIVRFDGTDA